MFEYYSSSNGHFGLIEKVDEESHGGKKSVQCPICGAQYHLLDRLDSMGWPVTRQR
jgi:hypothetical protein